MSIYTASEGLLIFSVLLGLIPMRQAKIHIITLLTQCFCIFASYGIFLIAHLIADFSLFHAALVINHEQSLFLRLAASWSDHAGSMFLWVIIYTAVFSSFLTFKPQIFSENVFLKRQSWALSLMIVYLLQNGNPFSLSVDQQPGLLNPLLHDVSLGFHPPIMYLGQTGLLFAASCVILLTNISTNIHFLQRIFLSAWAILTLGITWGSFWAYYELGWGGWWFWDPIENIALIPWLLGIIIIHHLRVQSIYNLQFWSKILLIILSFSIWIVRGSNLTSVHNFALDSRHNLITFFFSAFIMCIFGYRPAQQSGEYILPPPWLRIQKNLVACIAAILMGTLLTSIIYKFRYHLDLNFHPEFFEIIIVPLMVGSLACLNFFYHQKFPIIYILGAFFSILLLWYNVSLAFCALSAFISISLLGNVFLAKKLQKIATPAFLAHMGIGVLSLSIIINGFFATEAHLSLKLGQTFYFRGCQGVLRKIKHTSGDVLDKNIVDIQCRFPGGYTSQLQSTHHVYPKLDFLKPIVGLSLTPLGLFFVTHHPHQNKERIALHMRHDPFIIGIWLGGILIFLGGILSAIRRSFKVLKKL